MKLVERLKSADQDFEFYPTTEEIIARLVRDINEVREDRYWRNGLSSVLDIGAGNGKVLRALRDRAEFKALYAIEKSPILCQQLDAEIFITGTDFMEQSLLAKTMDVVYCNPPYSAYEQWSTKIVRESGAVLIYLLIPKRWQDSKGLADALAYRDGKAEVVGEFSFEDAEDRAARAKVHLLRIEFKDRQGSDPFARFFDEQFAGLKSKFNLNMEGKAPRSEEQQQAKQLVVGANYPERLVELYNRELDNVRKNYDLVSKLDASLLKEFDVTPARILECLRERLAGLRNFYWGQLFDNLRQVTDRLTTKKRRMMLETLQRNAHVDFTLGNIHAIVMWVLKNANLYIDEQLIETYEQMASKANVYLYKSNARPFVEDRWRYKDEKPTHFALEYRIVLHWVGGVTIEYRGYRLDNSAAEFIGDLLTVARNLGFLCDTADERLNYSGRGNWRGGEKQIFEYRDPETGAPRTLLEVKAFRNRNLHIRMDQKFALALNVEFGRLKGWLKNAGEAVEELNDPEAAKFFNTQLRLGVGTLPMLGAPAVAAAVVPMAKWQQNDLGLEAAS